MSSRIALALILIFLLTVSGISAVEAHRSGCHRWHSCPSDRGTYVCGDLGRVASLRPLVPEYRYDVAIATNGADALMAISRQRRDVCQLRRNYRERPPNTV